MKILVVEAHLDDIELACGGTLLHGECVAIGMVALCSDRLRERLLPVLDKLGLPHEADCDPDEVLALCAHDKKSEGSVVVAVLCRDPGTFVFQPLEPELLRRRILTVVKK